MHGSEQIGIDRAVGVLGDLQDHVGQVSRQRPADPRQRERGDVDVHREQQPGERHRAGGGDGIGLELLQASQRAGLLEDRQRVELSEPAQCLHADQVAAPELDDRLQSDARLR